MKKIILFLLIVTFIAEAQRPRRADEQRSARSPYAQSILWRDLHKSTQDSIRQAVADSLAALSTDGVTITQSGGTFQQKVFDNVAALAAASGSDGQVAIFTGNDTIGAGYFVLADSAYPEGRIALASGTTGKQWVEKNFHERKEIWITAFGADPTGTRRSAEQIEDALNFKPSNVSVYAPPGRYKIEREIVANGNNISFFGSPSASAWNGTADSSIATNFPYAEFVAVEDSLRSMFYFGIDDTTRESAQRYSGPLVENLIFSDKSPNRSIKSAIRINGKYNTRIYNCSFFDLGDGTAIYLDGGEPRAALSVQANVTGTIINPQIRNCRTGIKSTGMSNFWSITGGRYAITASQMKGGSIAGTVGLYPNRHWLVVGMVFDFADTAIVVDSKYAAFNRENVFNTFKGLKFDGCNNGFFFRDEQPTSTYYGTYSNWIIDNNLGSTGITIYDSTVTNYQANTYMNNIIKEGSVKFVGVQPPVWMGNSGGIGFTDYHIGKDGVANWDASSLNLNYGVVDADSILKSDSLLVREGSRFNDKVRSDSTFISAGATGKSSGTLNKLNIYESLSDTLLKVAATGSENDTAKIDLNVVNVLNGNNGNPLYCELAVYVQENGTLTKLHMSKVTISAGHNASVANRYYFNRDSLHTSGLTSPTIVYNATGSSTSKASFFVINTAPFAVDVYVQLLTGWNLKSIKMVKQ